MRVAPACLLLLLACGQAPLPGEFLPGAALPAPVTKVTPPPGPFNGELELTFSTELPATVFVSVDGSDPRTTSKGRLSGPSPFKVKLTATTAVNYFSSVGGRDETLKTGTWTRAGGPKGTISGVLVTGDFTAGTEVGVYRNAQALKLGKSNGAGEIPFSFSGLQAGTHRLFGIMDRNGDGQLTPILDFQSAVTTVTLDFADPFKASAEGVRLYLAASPAELCTIAGTISLPRPPPGQNLQISAISGAGFGAGFDPMSLLTQLQNGYRIFTNGTDTEYPYVITDLQPGLYVPVPSLIGFGGGGVAMNFLANPLMGVNCIAGQTAISDHAFGPVTLTGAVTIKAASAPMGAFNYGVIAAKNISLGSGIQAVLMPAVFGQDPTTMDLTGAFGAQALRSNSTFNVRVFVNGAAGTTNPIIDALTWVVNPFAPQPAQAVVNLGTTDQTVNVVVP